MKTKIYCVQALAVSTLLLTGCQVRSYASPPPPPPPPAPSAIQVMNSPASVSQAKQEFRNYRQAMGYVDGGGIELDRKSGYYDINIETIRALYDEAAKRGWNDIRVYNGIDNAGNRTLLINGLQLRNGTLEETSKADGDIVAKIDNPSAKGGTGCPRWCDVTGTVVGK